MITLYDHTIKYQVEDGFNTDFLRDSIIIVLLSREVFQWSEENE